MFKKAFSNFKSKISEIKSYTDYKKGLGSLYDAIYDYFSQKLKKNVSHLTFQKLEVEIKNYKNISENLLKELKDVIEKIEFLNYTSLNIDKTEYENIINKSLDVILHIEREFEK